MSRAAILFAILLRIASGLDWKTLDDAVADAKTDDKLVLFLVSKSQCKPCKKLTAELDASSEFAELSKKFVLAKAEDELPKDEKFNLDGKYVPKIVFLNANGDVLVDVVNADAKSDKAKYFYRKAEHVLKSMVTALDIFDLDHGFGKGYRWYDWLNGLKAAKEQNKPIMIVFHQDWCGACQRLKPKFAEAKEIKEHASEFIMINTDAEEIVKGDKYKADGEYYPKILFLDSDGEHYSNEWNHGTKHGHVLHYYGDGQEISLSMKRVLANRSLILADDHGFGKHINWVKHDQGLRIAKEQGKPMMVILHKSYCGACKSLKPKIREDKEFAELSKKFVMVNCQDDEEPTDDQYDQDGAYIPRIFFLDNLGIVESSIHNPSADYKKAKYAYGSSTSVVESMKKAIEMKLGEKSIGKTTSKSTSTANEPTATATEPTENDGFGTEITWYPYEEGLREAKKSHRAVMIVFYNDYCQFSKYMKMHFRDTPEIVEKSKSFVMVKVGEEEAKALGDKFDVDGTYTPRIFFMDPDQHIHKEVNNTDSPYTSTIFYYGTPKEILAGMNSALEKINLSLGRGFGEYIQWVKYEKALEQAKIEQKPVMMIIHKTWCGACKALKPIIYSSRPIWKLTHYFIMTNVEDEEEPLDNQYFIDGGYYPRIYFLDHEGNVHHGLHNRDPAFLKYKFSYANEEQLVQSMQFAIADLVQQAAPQGNTEPTTETTTGQESQTNDDEKLTPGKRILAQSGAHWVTIDEALVEAKASNKPIMFIIHRTTCPACKAVLKMISRDEQFKEKSDPFILADVEDDVDEEKADSYDVDGGYVPRTYFLSPDGKIFKDVWNKGTNYLENKFYYYEMNTIYRSMERALKLMETWSPDSDQNEGETKKKDEL